MILCFSTAQTRQHGEAVICVNDFIEGSPNLFLHVAAVSLGKDSGSIGKPHLIKCTRDSMSLSESFDRVSWRQLSERKRGQRTNVVVDVFGNQRQRRSSEILVETSATHHPKHQRRNRTCGTPEVIRPMMTSFMFCCKNSDAFCKSRETPAGCKTTHTRHSLASWIETAARRRVASRTSDERASTV